MLTYTPDIACLASWSVIAHIANLAQGAVTGMPIYEHQENKGVLGLYNCTYSLNDLNAHAKTGNSISTDCLDCPKSDGCFQCKLSDCLMPALRKVCQLPGFWPGIQSVSPVLHGRITCVSIPVSKSLCCIVLFSLLACDLYS